MHPHKHISKLLPMVNHNLQLQVECFKFEGVVISYKWTNGLLNVYMNDINSTIKRWQTIKVLGTSHNFYQIFLLSHCIYFYTQHWLQIQIPTTPHGLLICELQIIHYNVGISSINKFIKWTSNADSYGNNKLLMCVFLFQQMFKLHSKLKKKF
jgi:hypothetical protein